MPEDNWIEVDPEKEGCSFLKKRINVRAVLLYDREACPEIPPEVITLLEGRFTEAEALADPSKGYGFLRVRKLLEDGQWKFEFGNRTAAVFLAPVKWPLLLARMAGRFRHVYIIQPVWKPERDRWEWGMYWIQPRRKLKGR
jgi:hypothetical protein